MFNIIPESIQKENSIIEKKESNQRENLYNNDIPNDNVQLERVIDLLNKPENFQINEKEENYLNKICFDRYKERLMSEKFNCFSPPTTSNLEISDLQNFSYYVKKKKKINVYSTHKESKTYSSKRYYTKRQKEQKKKQSFKDLKIIFYIKKEIFHSKSKNSQRNLENIIKKIKSIFNEIYNFQDHFTDYIKTFMKYGNKIYPIKKEIINPNKTMNKKSEQNENKILKLKNNLIQNSENFLKNKEFILTNLFCSSSNLISKLITINEKNKKINFLTKFYFHSKISNNEFQALNSYFRICFISFIYLKYLQKGIDHQNVLFKNMSDNEFNVLNILVSKCKSKCEFFKKSILAPYINTYDKNDNAKDSIDINVVSDLTYLSLLIFPANTKSLSIQLYSYSNKTTFTKNQLLSLKKKLKLPIQKKETLLKLSSRYFYKKIFEQKVDFNLQKLKFNKNNLKLFKNDFFINYEHKDEIMVQFLHDKIQKNIFLFSKQFFESFNSQNNFLKYVFNSNIKRPNFFIQILISLHLFHSL